MPTEQFKDVRFDEDFEIQIRNQDHQFSEGDIAALPLNIANKAVNLWDVEATSASNPYEVLEREADETIGVKSSESNGDVPDITADEVENEEDYRQLQKYASNFEEVDASQSKEDLRDDLLERV